MSMKGFEPSFLDKLFDDEPRTPVAPALRRLSLEELKLTVARDVEAILNTRIVHTDEELATWPECRRSVVTYGLRDFSGLSLASHFDRALICRSIEQAISRHEPRLQQVKVTLELAQQSTNALFFAISALLVVYPAQEPVSFDALLQPSTLQYSVKRGRPRG
jgi:type VI secretion system protein ImpF